MKTPGSGSIPISGYKPTYCTNRGIALKGFVRFILQPLYFRERTVDPDIGLDREAKNTNLPTTDTLPSIRQSVILLLELHYVINWGKRFYFTGTSVHKRSSFRLTKVDLKVE
jgi:hypothetical protein